MALRHRAGHAPVRSEPLENGQPREERRPQTKPQGSLYALSLVLLAFGILGWLAGGKYTVEGWVVALNMFARWIGVEQQLIVPRGWWLVGAVAASGLIYSRVEMLALRNTVQRMPAFWIGWLLIVATDVGSTLIGVLNPPADAAPVLLQLAKLIPMAIVWALLLTFVPEWLILSATRIFRR
jgi:hypothetical protein